MKGVRSFAILMAVLAATASDALACDTLAVGAGHACGIERGHVRCWGANGDGQVGDGTFTARTSSVIVPGLSDVTEIAASDRRTCAINPQGIWCWGLMFLPERDPLRPFRVREPVLIASSQSFPEPRSLSIGLNHACAISRGRVYCWGRNLTGQVQPGELQGRSLGTSAPGKPVAGVEQATQVSVGVFHSCALLKSGEVSCWGSNARGAVGGAIGASGEASQLLGERLPRKQENLPGVRHLSSFGDTTCALSDTELRCWGGEIAQRHAVSSLGVVSSLSVGADYACAVIQGEPKCWGVSVSGDPRNPEDVPELQAITAIALKYGRVKRIAAGRDLSCAIAQEVIDENVYCWKPGARAPEPQRIQAAAESGPLSLLQSSSI